VYRRRTDRADLQPNSRSYCDTVSHTITDDPSRYLANTNNEHLDHAHTYTHS